MQYDNTLDDVVIPTHPCPPARCSQEQWDEEAAELEHIRGSFSSVAVAAADARCAWRNDPHGRYGGALAVRNLAQRGVPWSEIAAIIEDRIENVARVFCKADANVQAFIKAEQWLRTNGCPSYGKVAEATGLDKYQVFRLCERLGIKSDVVRKGPANEALIAEIKRLWEGTRQPSRMIAAQVGMSHSTVRKIIQRRGFKRGAVTT